MRKRKHTHGYVKRIIAYESNYTKADVIVLYREHWGKNFTYDKVIEELTFLSVYDIRWILRIGKYAK